MTQNWLTTLQPGDKVIISDGYGDVGHTAKVERITATQIIIGPNRFKRDTGDRIGNRSGWAQFCLMEPTDANLESVRRKYYINTLENVQWHKRSTDTLARIMTIVLESTKKQEV